MVLYNVYPPPVIILNSMYTFNIMEPVVENDETTDPALRDELKRFRKEYTKPVQFRWAKL